MLQTLQVKDSGGVIQAVGLVALTEAPPEILQEEQRAEGECGQTFSSSSLSSLTSAGKSGGGTVPEQELGLCGWMDGNRLSSQ